MNRRKLRLLESAHTLASTYRLSWKSRSLLSRAPQWCGLLTSKIEHEMPTRWWQESPQQPQQSGGVEEECQRKRIKMLLEMREPVVLGILSKTGIS